MIMKFNRLWCVWLLFAVVAPVQAATVNYFSYGSPWRFRLGTNEASAPVTTWRTNFNDEGWSLPVPTPIGYGAPAPVTFIPESDEILPPWQCVFMRRTFVVTNPAAVASATLTINIDDGYVVWINGTEITPRYNMPGGEPTTNFFASVAGEPVVLTHSVSNSMLRAGTNVIAIQSFNANLTSTDHYIDASFVGTIDDVPPTIAFQLPFAGSTVQSLTQIEVDFTENVSGVNATDLLINGNVATNVSALSGAAYLFRFPPAATGPVSVQFAAGHGIQDLAASPNAFGGASWSYTVDLNVIISEDVRLNEFVAVNVSGLRDENNEFQDWVELKNLSTNLVSLAGWSLSDDSDTPDKWVFPAVTIQPSGYLVVFCSGKDRKPTAPNSKLHTNFKLGSEGESILLYNADAPRRLVSAIESYPNQRRDYSYGYDPLGQLKYFSPPTPGSNNPPSSISGVVADTKFSHDRGFYETNFSLTITCATPGVTIRYTVDGKAPTTNVGSTYSAPIAINSTTVVRAFAYKSGLLPTDVDCHTYLYLNAVTNQAANGQPPAGWPATWGGNVVDYGMDPDIVTVAPWKDTIRDDLKAIPTFSIVANLDDLFNASTGIYANPGNDGPLWERPCSIELLNPEGEEGFQINCGIRLRGGFSRSTTNPKHAFRFFFRQEYGASKLSFPFFGPTGAKSFDKFDMRTMQNYSWSFQNDSRMTCLRDVMSRDAQLTMNGIGTRGNFYHLYINGMYWGLYNSEERPEAAFAESYIGGREEDYDTIKQLDGYLSGATDGNNDAWYRLWAAATNGFASNVDYYRVQGRNVNGTINTNYENLIDVPNLIDYMLVILYGGNLDAPISNFLGNDSPNNWYGFRDRTGQNGGFRFASHDAEHTMLNVNEDRTGIVDLSASGGQYGVIQTDWTAGNPLTQIVSGVYTPSGAQPRSTPQYIWFRMHQNPEFRILAADRIFKHCFNGGPLSVEGMRAAFLTRSNEIQRAIIAESARWGDAKNATPYTRNSWVSAMNTTMGFINGRTAVLINQLRADGLYPAIVPPSFNSTGGPVSSGFVFRMTNSNPSSTIYYTLDGADPRAQGGAVAPSALAYSAPLVINTITTVRSRVLSAGVWSPMNEVTFYPPQDLSKLLITEIMYHPPDIGFTDGDQFEFLEIKNTGTVALGLEGLRFTGIGFVFPVGATIGPGQFYVLSPNATAFASKYPGVTLKGTYTGQLANSGEALTLSHPLGQQIFSFTFGDLTPWPVTPDGLNFSLVPVDPNANPDLSEPKNWRASSALGGSPGADDPPFTVPPVLINEILTHTESGVDFIELFNPTTNTVNIGGWFLTDDPAVPKKYRIADGTFLGPLSYVVFNETNFNATPGTNGSFSLNAHGDDAYLFSGDSNTNLTGYDHGFSFAAAIDEETFGRYVISTGEAQFTGQITPTPGAANAGPRIGPIVINEIHYNPTAPAMEFVELKNISSNAVPLFDAAIPTNTWRVNGLSFSFPTNRTLPPGAFVLLVLTNINAFTNFYSVPPGVQIYGPYLGNLQDSGERLELQQPDTTGTNGVGYITIDAVRYNDRAPWPPAADGSGPSLQKRMPGLYGNEPLNWKAAGPTPGSDTSGGDEPLITAQPQSQSAVLGSNVTFSITVTGTPPFQYVWRLNGTNLPGSINAELFLPALQAHQAGTYSVNVFNEAGFVTSSNATLVIVNPVTFTVHPANQNVLPGTNVTLTSTAVGTGTVRYQWRYEGTNILNATNASYSFTNASFAEHGIYSVVARDDISAATSSNAFIFVLVRPVILTHVTSQTVLQGRTATFSLVATGAPPLGYRWIRNSGSAPGATTSVPVLVITNVQASGTIRVAVTNVAAPAGVFSPGPSSGNNVLLTMLADADGDGVADAWETQYGFSTTNAADALLDFDGDGMSNHDEYVSGTNPTNALSVLKVVFSTSNATELNFTAQTNLSYAVQWNTNLTAPVWSNLTSITSQSLVRTVVVDTATAPPSAERYYRVVTPLVP
jgi:hypothetical protein